MNKKEKQVQKALGTFPTFICDNCHEKFFGDAKYTYTHNNGAVMYLCTTCATAQFVCNKLMGVPMGEFTKEND